MSGEGKKNSPIINNDSNKRKDPPVDKSDDDDTPDYGSKEYWESRYKFNLENNRDDGSKDEAQADSNKKQCLEHGDNSRNENTKGHAWYFTYEELKPLIIPLLLGQPVASDEEDEDENEDIEGEEVDNDDGKKDSSAKNEETQKEKDHSVPILPTQQKSMLEIGCGDMPIATDFAKEEELMIDFENENKTKTKKPLLKRVVCFDYSSIVIQQLKEEDSHNNDERIEYTVLDARSLPYKNNEFDIILDKGTLDAMLSDKIEGKKNCIAIVREAARVCSSMIIIISHLNANTSKGLNWVQDVLVEGLQTAEDSNYSDWVIEVHGNDAILNEDEELIEEEDDDEIEIEEEEPADDIGNDENQAEVDDNEDDCDNELDYGPAVYIIRKTILPSTSSSSDDTKEKAERTIPLKFFSY